MRGIDATLQEIAGRIYDIKIGFDGDIETEDAFDSAILVSLASDRRANESEVPNAAQRRGWIGNEDTPGFEQGSKLWLFEQSRLTRTVMNQVSDEARNALQWLVGDDLAVRVLETSVRVTESQVVLEVQIERSPSIVEQRFFDLWDNTGV
jgi:phage gp46-like protein